MTKLTLSQLSSLLFRACDDLRGIAHADIRQEDTTRKPQHKDENGELKHYDHDYRKGKAQNFLCAEDISRIVHAYRTLTNGEHDLWRGQPVRAHPPDGRRGTPDPRLRPRRQPLRGLPQRDPNRLHRNAAHHRAARHQAYGEAFWGVHRHLLADGRRSRRRGIQILYEGRTADTAVKDKHGFDSKFEGLFKERSQEEILAIKNKYGATGDLLQTSSRIEAIARSWRSSSSATAAC